MHCRYCKAKDHWSTQCPHKDRLGVVGDEGRSLVASSLIDMTFLDEIVPGAPLSSGDKYQVTSARGLTSAQAAILRGENRDENSLKISNLPPHTDEQVCGLLLRVLRTIKRFRPYVAR